MNISYGKYIKIRRKKIYVPSDYLYIELYDMTNTSQFVRCIISSFGDSFSLTGKVKDFYDELVEYNTSLSEIEVKLFEYKKHSIITNIFSELLLEDIHNKDLNKILSLTNCTGGLQLFLNPEKERKNLLEFLCSNTFRDDYYILNDFFKQKINSIYAFVYDKSIDIVLPLSYFSLCQGAIYEYVNNQFTHNLAQ